MATKNEPPCLLSLPLIILLLLLSGPVLKTYGHFFEIEEATIKDVQRAFTEKKLTSRQLVDYYLSRIESLNPVLRGVIEVNPDALHQAERADVERERNNGSRPSLHGIPVLLKDSIATKDKLNTTGGSYALLGAVVPRDAGVVERLRNAGAVILGKASMSEWYHFRSSSIPSGWCARSGQVLNPYVKEGDPCGSSSGSAISVAANMAMVSLGTETDGSLICPGDHNSVVAIKPTVGLTSRAGVIPMSPRQDTIGPLCRTVSDAAYVLDSIVGFDPRDSDATKAAAKFIPTGGYTQFLKKDGLKGKRLGVVKNPFLPLSNISSQSLTFETHLQVLREKGATILDNLEIQNIDVILNPLLCGEALALMAEFKITLNKYLKELINSPERTEEFGQDILIAADSTNGIGDEERQAIETMEELSKDGFEKLMLENELDAMVTLGSDASTVLAIGGFPAITVPAGYDSNGMPFGIFFGGLKGTEPTLIEIAYSFEQIVKLSCDVFGKSYDLAHVYILQVFSNSYINTSNALSIKEATVEELQTAFKQNQLTSRQLTEFYLNEIRRLNPILKGVIEVNPDALYLAEKSDRERKAKTHGSCSRLHGIPILLKDNIGTKDKLNTSAGSFALVGSVVAKDAGVVKRLREAGAIVIGKASLSEWTTFRSLNAPNGWSARGAILVDNNLEIANVNTILNFSLSGEATAILAEFKISLNDYLKELVTSPVRSLAEVIAFNQKFSDVVSIRNLENLTKNGFVKLMIENKLDALVSAGPSVAPVLAIGVPIGICFGGLKGSEPILLEIAYGFEQATKRFFSQIDKCDAVFPIKEATIKDIHSAFNQNQLTSKQLVEFYLEQIKSLNPILKGVIEVNPDAIHEAIKADEERKAKKGTVWMSKLHGIPFLLKDNIATKDKLNTTAGSLALLRSVVPRDAAVAKKLREAGAIILGKASMTEWAAFRGSAISVAANLATATLGTETDGSILCPSSFNSVVGIKPTVGLTSRAGVIPISPRQDTVGTVSDAVYVLDAIVGYDSRDAEATKKASKYIPHNGYAQFLKSDGLKGKRLGIVRNPFYNFDDDKLLTSAFEHHLQTLRRAGAILVDNLEISHIETILDSSVSGEDTALNAEFKMSLNAYLKELVASPVQSLADVIAFNKKFSDEEKIKEFGQDTFLVAEATNGIGKAEKKAVKNLSKLSKNGFVKLMKTNKLHALVAGGPSISTVLAIGGFPGISVPAVYTNTGVPIGMSFGGLKGSEPSLIEIAYAFEQETKIRKPPTFL
ncbi:hypothetical protein ACJIZ3_015316 [Penstemon smallii]|uniref:Amidase domain-containing protein n=1 Tax=Penstemon smallii TaxID=265156 RepID=A0ABD3RMC9_9LAMI